MTGEEAAGPPGTKLLRLLYFAGAGFICTAAINKWRDLERKAVLQKEQGNQFPEKSTNAVQKAVDYNLENIVENSQEQACDVEVKDGKGQGENLLMPYKKNVSGTESKGMSNRELHEVKDLSFNLEQQLPSSSKDEYKLYEPKKRKRLVVGKTIPSSYELLNYNATVEAISMDQMLFQLLKRLPKFMDL